MFRLIALLLSTSIAASNVSSFSKQTLSNYQLPLATSRSSLEKCPPCFNCLLPAFTCGQYGDCDPYNGQCRCPPGWGGIDCLIPQCDSLADGDQRRLREDGKSCECKDGWAGINCNGTYHFFTHTLLEPLLLCICQFAKGTLLALGFP